MSLTGKIQTIKTPCRFNSMRTIGGRYNFISIFSNYNLKNNYAIKTRV